jgi:Ni/Fe-hydrogenase subunit HybB-like protein
MSHAAVVHAPVGGDLWTPAYKKLLVVVAIGAAAALWRFVFGIGAVSNLSDGYPWGVWIAIDVVVGTALGCGGYAVALLVYVLNRGEYHALVRPAILTSLLGYGLAVIAVTIDLGRFWALWKVPIYFWRWTGSPQLEVALCVALYVMVLGIELSPALFEKWRESGRTAIRRFAERALTFLERYFVWILALGLLLPTMHQSSLGTMMLLPATKLHPLWFTPWLPMLFLVNALMMGYGAVVLESHLAVRAFKRPLETEMLGRLARIVLFVAVAWLTFRLGELVLSGDLVYLASWRGAMFLLETGLHAGVVWLLASKARRFVPAQQFRAAILLVSAGVAYRVNVYLVAFQPPGDWVYFPAVPELLITFGIIAAEIAIYIAVVKKFPILAAHRTDETVRIPVPQAKRASQASMTVSS